MLSNLALEEITRDASIAASYFWWKAHDDKNYVLAGELFSKQEATLGKYLKTTNPNFEKAAAFFTSALQVYDNFTRILEGGEGDFANNEIQLRTVLHET